MKISWKWLERYVDLSGIDPLKTGEQFTISVAEIDEIIEVGKDIANIRAALVLELNPHPNAKKLTLATIDIGCEKLTVICGAPNVKVGMMTAFAGIGTTVNDKSGEKFTIEDAEIRGVRSAGMLVSPMELGFGDDHAGIMELPDGIEAGQLFKDIAPVEDIIWDIDNKSLTHRPDLWGHMGIAREVASLVGRELKTEISKPLFNEEDPLTIHNEDLEFCPRYTAFTMDGIKIAPSPFWMQVLLYNAGMRPINNIVDFTNFTMLSVGNPIHVFDSREMGGKTIKIRRATESEEMITLDGEKHSLTTEDLVIADEKRPVALAGIMGGQNSEVAGDTTSIILESANFHPGKIRRTAVRLGIRTESSSRFEKSLDPNSAQSAAFMFANLVTEHLDSSKVSSRFYDHGAKMADETVISMKLSFIQKRLGIEVSSERIVEILTSLGFKIQLSGDDLEVGVPSYRATKDISIPEDIVEEVGRIYGYGNIEPKAPVVELHRPWSLPSVDLGRKVRDCLSGDLGFNQVMTYSFDKMSLIEKTGLSIEKALFLKNPISKEEPVLRQTMVLNLLDLVQKNERNETQLRLYEVGSVFSKAESGAIPVQPKKLSMVIGDRELKKSDKGELFYQMKYLIERLVQRLEKGELTIDVADEDALAFPWVHPVRSAIIKINGVRVGYFSLLHPKIAKNLSLGSEVCVGVLDLDKVVVLNNVVKLFEPLPRFPGIKHDVSIIVDKKIKSSQVQEVLGSIDATLFKSVECIDVYEGDKFPGKRSLSFRLLFQHPERTLKQEEIATIHEKIVEKVSSLLGGSILT
jgi:phenylalanyl-tRNA synthetase beta chain